AGGRVKLHGRVDPVPYFARADALVQTARWEGLPRVALEAIAMGRPTVGYDVKGVQDIPGAYLAPPGNVEALADATVDAVRLGARALPEPSLLSFEHTARALLNFTQDVATGRAKGAEYRRV